MAERFFHEELDALRRQILQMGFLVEQAVHKANLALLERQLDAAREVLKEEAVINQLEIQIDDHGHSCLALGQPMAVDLRLITVILKMNTDLERIGDHAVNIAERSLKISREPTLENYVQIPEMARATQKMLSDALISFKKGDVALAHSVLERDDEIDAFNNSLYEELEEILRLHPAVTKAGMNLVMIGHNFERIADLANNIAEDVIYLKQGKEVRHHSASS